MAKTYNTAYKNAVVGLQAGAYTKIELLTSDNAVLGEAQPGTFPSPSNGETQLSLQFSFTGSGTVAKYRAFVGTDAFEEGVAGLSTATPAPDMALNRVDALAGDQMILSWTVRFPQ